MELNGKTALITGGAARVGRAITLGLAQAGARVAVHYNWRQRPCWAAGAAHRTLWMQCST